MGGLRELFYSAPQSFAANCWARTKVSACASTQELHEKMAMAGWYSVSEGSRLQAQKTLLTLNRWRAESPQGIRNPHVKVH